MTAFTSYGSFWLTLVDMLILPKMGLVEVINEAHGEVLLPIGAYKPRATTSEESPAR